MPSFFIKSSYLFRRGRKMPLCTFYENYRSCPKRENNYCCFLFFVFAFLLLWVLVVGGREAVKDGNYYIINVLIKRV